MKNICILMSTYNGAKYLKEQIESIFKQENVNPFLYIRDDGSTDVTVNILQAYMNLYPEKIKLYFGNNIGFANSFYELLKSAPKSFDYYAFSDQDDIWLPNKLDNAIKHLNNKKPILYACNLLACDFNKNLKYQLFDTTKNQEYDTQFNKYPYIFNTYGCTMVWNKALQNIILKYKKPEQLPHDMWVFFITKALGMDFIFDYNCNINYRLHDNNTCGATPKSLFDKAVKFFKNYIQKKHSLCISLRCQYLRKYFPQKNTLLSNSLADYSKSIFTKLKAIRNILKMEVNNSQKFKFICLIFFDSI